MNSSDFKIDRIDFNSNALSNYNSKYGINYPVVYFLSGKNKNKKAYVGETTNLKRRMQDHLKNTSRKSLDDAYIILSERFNKSATYNIETNLIRSILADEEYELQNISQTKISCTYNYFNKEYYDNDMFENIWNNMIDLGIAKNNLDTLKNKDIYKLSPFTSLTENQFAIKEKILDFCLSSISNDRKAVFVVQGEAGTGKSVLLSSIYKTLLDYSIQENSKLYKCDSYLLVNHNEMHQAYSKFSKVIKHMKKKYIMRPTPFVNMCDKNDVTSDITIVDEAHLLLTQEDKYNSFYYDNHLEQIIEKSKITILFLDYNQSVRSNSIWDENKLKKILKGKTVKTEKLHQQLRMNATYEIQEWINLLLKKELHKPPTSTPDFEFKIFDNCQNMYEEIKKRNSECGLSRVVATFDYLHKKNGSKYYVEEGCFKLPWNFSVEKNKSWAEIDKTIDEVGSIYTVQGFDLNYVGVIIGKSFIFDKDKNQIVINPENNYDTGALKGLGARQASLKIKEQLIVNALNILLKRGIKGLYIYFADQEISKQLVALEDDNLK